MWMHGTDEGARSRAGPGGTNIPIPVHRLAPAARIGILVPSALARDRARATIPAMSIEVTNPDREGPPPDYCCVVLRHGEAFVLERRPAHKAHAPGRLTCFGGRREAGEDPAACLARELREEIGESPPFGEPRWALCVGGQLIAWFWEGTLTGPVEAREPGVSLVYLLPTELDHPDLSTWHRPILAAAICPTNTG